MKTQIFNYNDNNYTYTYDENDTSGTGCLMEIGVNNEYKLDKYMGLTGKFLLDIGGNCGVVTMILAKQNPFSTIITIEPYSKCYEIIKTNIKNRADMSDLLSLFN